MRGVCGPRQSPVLGCQKHARLITLHYRRTRFYDAVDAHRTIGTTRYIQRPRTVCGAAGADKPSLDQSPGLMEGLQEQQEQTKWATATVTQNRYLCKILSACQYASPET